MEATLLGEMQLGQQEWAGPSRGTVPQQEGRQWGYSRELGETILRPPGPRVEHCHSETGTPTHSVRQRARRREQRCRFFCPASIFPECGDVPPGAGAVSPLWQTGGLLPTDAHLTGSSPHSGPLWEFQRVITIQQPHEQGCGASCTIPVRTMAFLRVRCLGNHWVGAEWNFINVFWKYSKCSHPVRKRGAAGLMSKSTESHDCCRGRCRFIERALAG